MAQKTIRQALHEALVHEMRRDPRVVVIGEDVVRRRRHRRRARRRGRRAGRHQRPDRRIRRGANHRHADHRNRRSWAPPLVPRSLGCARWRS